MTSPLGFVSVSNGKLFDFPAWYVLSMLACIGLGTRSFCCADMIDKIKGSRRRHNDQEPSVTTAADIRETLQAFADDVFSSSVEQRWFVKAFKVAEQHEQDSQYLTTIIETTGGIHARVAQSRMSHSPALKARPCRFCILPPHAHRLHCKAQAPRSHNHWTLAACSRKRLRHQRQTIHAAGSLWRSCECTRSESFACLLITPGGQWQPAGDHKCCQHLVAFRGNAASHVGSVVRCSHTTVRFLSIVGSITETMPSTARGCSGVHSRRASNLCCPGSSATSCNRLPPTLPNRSQAVSL